MSNRQIAAVLVGLGVFASAAHALDYGRNPDPGFELDSFVAGASPAHRLSFSVAAGELETFRARLRYPEGFRFRGFDALGPPGTPVGAYEMDFNGDGVADVRIVLLGLARATAYADVIPDGTFSPGLEPVLDVTGAGDFILTLPFGGDANPRTTVVPFDARISLVLFPGLLVNPDRPGTHALRAELISVDPDTDGADDGRNAAPGLLELGLDVTIEGPARARFRGLCIDKAVLDDREIREDDGAKGGDRLTVEGRYAIGRASNGIDVPRESVTVQLGPFTQTIPGAAFSRSRDENRFKDRRPGVTKLELGADM
jgi:hypothetical protein